MSCHRCLPLALVLLLTGGAAAADTFVVTKTADTADGSCAPGDCSLREAVIAANANPGADTIEIPAGTYVLTRAGDDDTASLGDLDLTGPTTIVGEDAATTIIDAGGLDRVFDVDPSSSGIAVALSGLTIRNGSQAFGGGILNRGTLTLSDCVVTSNGAHNGGGILNLATLTLQGVTLSGNQAITTGSLSDGFGGALFNQPGATATLTGATVSGNQASRDGGALFNHTASLVIDGGTFGSNSAGASGGAVASAGTLTVKNALFSGNTANDGGAIASLAGGQLTVEGGTFAGNQAQGVDLGGGGAFFLYGTTATIQDAAIEGNTAYGEGGGAIEVQGTLAITGGIVRNNVAVKHDEEELPPDTASGFGGGLLVILGSQVTSTGVVYENNQAGRNGGAIYLDRDATLVAENAVFTSNTAQTGHGGGVYSEGDFTIRVPSVFVDNEAAGNGGGLAVGFGTSLLSYTTVTHNDSGQGGGGVYVAPGARLTVVESEVVQNTAATFGGGLLNEGITSARDAGFFANQAQTGAGLYGQTGGVVALTRTVIAGNTAAVNGGGMWNEGTVTLARSRFTGNVGDFGGALGNRAGAVQMLHVSLDSNQARVQGGALYNFDGGSLVLLRSSVTGNRSHGEYAGGIGNAAALVAEHVTIANNQSDLAGGGLLLSGASANTTLDSVTVAYNGSPQATAWRAFGGAIDMRNVLVVGTCASDGTTLTSLGGNLESPLATCGFVHASDRSSVAEAGLADLASPDGLTYSFTPLAGSPAIDGGVAGCGGFDQHGSRRPQDGDGVGGLACDVGAVEVPEAGAPAGIAALAVLFALRRAHRAA